MKNFDNLSTLFKYGETNKELCYSKTGLNIDLTIETGNDIERLLASKVLAAANLMVIFLKCGNPTWLITNQQIESLLPLTANTSQDVMKTVEIENSIL